ncbi:probable G-protein coupled receptor 139 [Rhincodon typus]|uniref:probable G-protein coupled receptor 139 n=1 Tax=Rhincodon typus TaxID=259920 RepID=UPI00202FF21D|nr:probable G-protein coupled receptor 139 [Rhincodon typus]XP_048448431.1 probable G-protein coupled receptor 139 [Rhincodon typus]
MRRTIMSQIESVYYPALAVVGVPGNGVEIVILSRGKCGLSRCITHYLVPMAMADLMVITCNLVLRWIVVLHWRNSFLHYTSVCKLILFGSSTAIDISVWTTVAFTSDHFVAICCLRLKPKYCTRRTAAVVIIALSLLFCLKNIPWFFLYISCYTINNIPRGCLVSPKIYTQTVWIAFSWIEQLLTLLLPFLLILFFNILTIRCILVASKAQRNFWEHNKGESERQGP